MQEYDRVQATSTLFAFISVLCFYDSARPSNLQIWWYSFILPGNPSSLYVNSFIQLITGDEFIQLITFVAQLRTLLSSSSQDLDYLPSNYLTFIIC
jgi:hypothetical protein